MWAQPSETLGKVADKRQTFIPKGHCLLLLNSPAFMHFLILLSFSPSPKVPQWTSLKKKKSKESVLNSEKTLPMSLLLLLKIKFKSV